MGRLDITAARRKYNQWGVDRRKRKKMKKGSLSATHTGKRHQTEKDQKIIFFAKYKPE